MRDITRREALVIGAAASLTPSSAWSLTGSRQSLQAFSFAYFSDTHVSLERNRAECRKMLDEFTANYTPDFAINGGDVVDYGWAGEYDSYDKVLGGFGFKTHHVPGNHDVRWSPLGLKIFQERVGPPYSAFDHKGCHFVQLDSTVPLSHWGHYESEMLRWLEEDLKKVGTETPVFVTTHHWVGRSPAMVDNERRLLKILEPHNVAMVLTGHGHSDLLWDWDGMLCTMNKGLYQGSYQRIEIDPEKGEARLSRRTTGKPELGLLASRPLKAAKEKRAVWALSTAAVLKGRPIELPLGEANEHSWNGTAFAPIEGGTAKTDLLVSGDHELHLRDRVSGRTEVFPIRVTDPGSNIQERWRRKLTGGVMNHLKHDGTRLYASAMDGSVFALDPETGSVQWKAKTGAYCHSSPVRVGDLVVVGSADALVYGLEAATGRTKWTFKTEGPVYSSATHAKGVCAIASGDGRVYGLDQVTGKEVWRYALPKTNTSFIQSPGTTDGERFFFGAWDNYLYALDAATGALLWRSICCERTFAFSPAIGGPAVSGGRVVVPANGNVLYCFDTATGKTIWEYASPGDKVGYSGPRIVDGRIYIGCLGDNGEARCIELEDGKEVWCAKLGEVVYDSSPSVSDGYVCVGSVNSLLSFVDQKSGEVVERYRMPRGHVLASPEARDGWIWAASYSDYVLGFRLKTV